MLSTLVPGSTGKEEQYFVRLDSLFCVSGASTGGREVFLGYLKIIVLLLEYVIDIIILFLLLFV